MALTPTKQHTKYAAWLMLCRSLAVRLDFDMRILPKEVLLPVISEFNSTILETARSIANLTGLTAGQMSQLQLPGHLGGLFLTNPLIKLEVAHLSSVAASWHPTYQWLLEKGYETSLAANSIDTHAATRSLRALAEQHIYVSAAGEICSQYTPSPLLSFETPLGACVHALQGKLTN